MLPVEVNFFLVKGNSNFNAIFLLISIGISFEFELVRQVEVTLLITEVMKF